MKEWSVHSIKGILNKNNLNSQSIMAIRKQTAAKKAALVITLKTSGSEKLSSLIAEAVNHNERIWGKLGRMFEDRTTLISTLLGGEERKALLKSVKKGFGDVEDILKAVWLIGEASESTRIFVDRLELLWILESLQVLMGQAGFRAAVIDSSQLIHTTKIESGYRLRMDKTGYHLNGFLKKAGDVDTLLIGGGWALCDDNSVVDPDENSGELSAAAIGAILNADSITFWNRKDMLMTADIEEVPSASIIPEITYAEATELSYFGAKVLHPLAMAPAMAKNIPIYLRGMGKNQINHPGTRVSSRNENSKGQMVKGFSAIHHTALINIEGAGMIGVPGISSRLFTSMRNAGISVVLISQASSEHSICFAVSEKEAGKAEKVVRRTFAEELAGYRINSVEVERDCAILAAVGEAMPGVPGIAAKFFGALGKAGVNVRAIAQGSSERNISAVIKGMDSTKALRALHASFFLSNQTLSIGLFGPGLIGATLLSQISRESGRLKTEFGVDLRIRAIADSKNMLIDDYGIDLSSWKDRYEKEAVPIDLKKYTEHVAADYFPHTVFIDCSTSSILPKHYVEWIQRGIHIITPNKKAGTEKLPDYHALMDQGRKKGMHFLYETTVGAGLPIINTLKDLIQTGDRIQKIEGVLSGTLAYLFWRFDGSVPFSTLVREAKELGYTEPDPRDDLSGMDIVRKAVILAREIGIEIEIEDVPVHNLIPEKLRSASNDEFMDKLGLIDAPMLKMQKEADKNNQLLKYVGVIKADGTCTVELKGYPKDHPFARITGTDNIVAFTTDRYHEQPLVIQGPGAGPEVTAGGVFADLLRLGAYLGARF
ncbi:MAG: bifunctional aspartate kinase/homoserine dehydrogenase I [Spirochaetales bacterium]|nr:bifunctional aspartate kinase/homoserine dehydrogenase I [Spirochaetales bacterium]